VVLTDSVSCEEDSAIHYPLEGYIDGGGWIDVWMDRWMSLMAWAVCHIGGEREREIEYNII
jgi:hypothetical protein